MTSVTATSATTDAAWLRRTRLAIPQPAAIAATALLVLSALSFWGVAYTRVLGRVQEQRSQRLLHAALREQLARQTSPIGGAIAVGAPVAFLRMPSIGVREQVVVEGTSSGTLEAGPGHRRDTPLPGQPGVSVLMGRSAAFGAPFGPITRLRAGASIVVETGQGTFRYRVERLRRDGDDLPPPLPAGGSRLTLITSEGTTNLTGGWERHTLFVDALLRGRAVTPPVPTPVRRLSSVETTMAGDPRAIAAVAAWLAALVVATAAAAWIGPRWGPRPTLLVAAPVTVMCLWGATEVAARLVPNLV